MNANPAGSSFPHLDLEDLIAAANGHRIGDRGQQHLGGCDRCQLEAARWNLVADGVRGLAAPVLEATVPGVAVPGATVPAAGKLAAAALGAGLPGPAVPSPGLGRPGGRRQPPRPGRRARLAGSAAAGVVLLGGAVYGVAASHLVHVSRNGSHTQTSAATALTAVTGCSQLRQAGGTLVQASGGRLVIETAGGQLVTVTATASTFVGESGALLGDITDGAPVTVAGPRAGAAIAARLVTIGNPAHAHPQTAAGDVVVSGTVADAGPAGFTVVSTGGTRTAVTTSGETVVNLVNPGLGRLPDGAAAVALGHAGPGGTLSAQAIAVIVQLPAGGPQIHGHLSVRVNDCSPASVNHAVLTLAAGG